MERWFAARVAVRRAFVALLATSGAALGLLSLPVLPLPRVDSALDSLLGWAVPPLALTHDLHGMYGWDEHAATVDRVYRSLPARDRERASVLTASYSRAAALNVLREQPVPRAVSGHMTYYLWGPDGDRGEVLIAYGIPREFLERRYRTCTEQARIDPALARPSDRDLPVYVCREPTATIAELWPELKRFDHGRPPSTTGPQAARPGG